MKNLLSIIFLLVAASSTSQTITDVYGNWKFESVSEELTEKKGDIKKITPYLDKIFFNFYPDGNYESGIMGASEAGKFTMEGNMISAFNGSGTTTYTVLAATPETLTLKIRTIAIIVSKVAPTADKLQLAKNWLLTGIRKPGGDTTKITDNSTVVFNVNGTYNVAMGATKESGNWDYREVDGKKILVLNANGRVKYWQVVSADSKQLVTVLNSNGQEFIFSAH